MQYCKGAGPEWLGSLGADDAITIWRGASIPDPKGVEFHSPSLKEFVASSAQAGIFFNDPLEG